MKQAIAVATLWTALFAGAPAAHAAQIRVLASNGIKAAVEALQPQLEKAAGDTLSIEFNTAATLRERIEKGEPFDVAILTDEAMDALIKAGKLSPMMHARTRRVGFRFRQARRATRCAPRCVHIAAD